MDYNRLMANFTKNEECVFKCAAEETQCIFPVFLMDCALKFATGNVFWIQSDRDVC